MATKTKKRSKVSSAKRKRGNLTAWLSGAGILLLITVPIIINLTRQVGLPGEGFTSQGNTHISSVGANHPEYNSNPPTSGWHVGNIANWGSYDYVVPDELLLHNLEDGGVILYYPLGTPEENRAEIERLEEVARGFRRTVIAPREDFESGYVLTAWQRLERFDTVDEEGMTAFLDAFEGIDHH